MTLHELIHALAQIVADGKSEVVIEANGVTVDEDDLLELRVEWVEKFGSRVVLHCSD